MSLKGAIERARKNGHPETLGLGFESLNFPEIEEGVHLFRQLLPWLQEEYPGRVMLWRLQVSTNEADSKQNCRDMVLEAEAVMQMYRDAHLQVKTHLALEVEPPLSDVTEEVEADSGFQVMEGWRLYWMDSLLDGGGLVRLKFRLQTNRMVWAVPRIELRANASLIGIQGTLGNLADVTDDRVWSGGLERGIARVIAKNIVPAIEQQKGKEIFWKNN